VEGQIKISEELEKLRTEGKTKSARFRESLVKWCEEGYNMAINIREL
jgi:hypothetical protein